jgi:transposase-like protein
MSNNYFEAYTKRCPHCGSTNFVGVPGVHFFKDRNFTCNNCKKGFEKPENVPNVTSGQSYTTNARKNGNTHSGDSEAKKIGRKIWKKLM